MDEWLLAMRILLVTLLLFFGCSTSGMLWSGQQTDLRPDQGLTDAEATDDISIPDMSVADNSTDSTPDNSTPDMGLPSHCQGPLETPIAGCTPTRIPDTGDLAADCVERINIFRAECQCLPPLMRWREAEGCAESHAEYDSTRSPHAGFRDRICSPSGRAQNECPGYRSLGSTIGTCLQQMWDEGPGEPFSEHGHYLNMSSLNHTRVACGFFTASSGRVWAIQNFQ